MPVYEYNCEECGPFTKLRGLDQSSAPANCPECGTSSPKIFSVINLRAMRPENRIAWERNERSANAPHVCGSGCLHGRTKPKPCAITPGGKVLAVDVQPEMVNLLQSMVRKTGLTNIEPSLSSEVDVKLPASSVDLAIMVDVYHELAFPYEVLASIIRALKPGGQVVFVEYRAEDPKVPIKTLHKMSEAQIKREAAVHALVWERTVSTLPWQHLVVFRKRN